MRSSPILLAAIIGMLGLASSAGAGDIATDRQPQVSAAAKKTAKEEALKQGMPAEEVLKLLGRPSEVRPMQAPTGKAEVWSYRTRQELSRERFEIASRPITTMGRGNDGSERQQVIGHESVFRTKKRILVRTFQLLMFNDCFLNEKIAIEEVQETE